MADKPRRVRVDWEPLLAAVACGDRALQDDLFLDLRTGRLRYFGAEGGEEELLPIAPMTGAEARQILLDFVRRVPRDEVRRQLDESIATVGAGPGAFGKAMEILASYPDVAREWRRHERRALVARTREQLAGAGVEAENAPAADPPEVSGRGGRGR